MALTFKLMFGGYQQLGPGYGLWGIPCTEEQHLWFGIYVKRHGLRFGSATGEYVKFSMFGQRHYQECTDCRTDYETKARARGFTEPIVIFTEGEPECLQT